MIEVVFNGYEWRIIRGTRRESSVLTEDRARRTIARLGLVELDSGHRFERWGLHPSRPPAADPPRRQIKVAPLLQRMREDPRRRLAPKLVELLAQAGATLELHRDGRVLVRTLGRPRGFDLAGPEFDTWGQLAVLAAQRRKSLPRRPVPRAVLDEARRIIAHHARHPGVSAFPVEVEQ